MSSVIAIIPKNVLTGFKTAVDQALESEGKRVKAAFDSTASDFDDKPTFTIKSSPGQREISTTHKIYGFVNNGTAPHIISPLTRLFLAFPGFSRPKTRPGQLGSTGGHTAGPEVFARQVHHPGTKARKFDKIIAREAAPLLARAINSAVGRVAR